MCELNILIMAICLFYIYVKGKSQNRAKLEMPRVHGQNSGIT